MAKIVSFVITPTTTANVLVTTPLECQFLRVAAGGLQLEKITITAKVQETTPSPGFSTTRVRLLRTRQDGETLGMNERYIGSVQIVTTVWHVFEIEA